MAIAKASPWSSTDAAGATDNLPASPIDSVSYENADFNQILTYKRILPEDTSFVIPTVNSNGNTVSGLWVQGAVYNMYDDLDTTGNFIYVMNDLYSVYKCIWNNNAGPSTQKPTSLVTSGTFTTADNYVWKYMFTVPPADVGKFITPLWIPVRADGTATDQTAVQTAAVDGAVHVVKITSGGSGYGTTTGIPVTIASGDGTGFVATATSSGGVITSIVISNVGANYTYLTLTIGGAGTGAVTRAIISPLGGHGSSAVKELSAFYVMINSIFAYGEGGIATTNNDYRKILLIQDPLLLNGSSQAYPGAPIVSGLTVITFSNVSTPSGPYQIDEVVTGSTGGAPFAQGKVVDYDATNKILRLTELTKPFTGGDTITGLTSSASGTTPVITPKVLKDKTGSIIYKDYRRPITRSLDQRESLFAIVEF